MNLHLKGVRAAGAPVHRSTILRMARIPPVHCRDLRSWSLFVGKATLIGIDLSIASGVKRHNPIQRLTPMSALGQKQPLKTV
jgi:hypothetical protein